MGFRDDFQTVPVFFVRRIAEAVKKAGGYPFVTDNPTAIYNAVDRGYTSETCGCPLIPIAGVKDKYAGCAEIGYEGVEDVEVAGVLRDSDALINVAHAKGHATCSYGGLIKNIALGGLAAGSRWHKMHGVEEHIPWWNPDKCTAQHAAKLEASCPTGALRYDAKKHKLNIQRGQCLNSNCMRCMKADEGVGCIEIKPENFEAFQRLMAYTASAILKGYKPEKVFNFNFMLDITPQCNCLGMIQPQIVPDVGVVASRDMVACEEAALDLIKEAGLIEKMIPPYIDPLGADLKMHPFARLWGGFKDPYNQTRFAEELKLGSRKYKLVEILPPKETAKMPAPKIQYENQPTFF
jgi:uncharacterized Fe-S center protein